MPLPNPKNYALSQSATDLGLGDMLRQQVEDQTDELKKKRVQQSPQNALFGAAAMNLLGPAGQ